MNETLSRFFLALDALRPAQLNAIVAHASHKSSIVRCARRDTDRLAYDEIVAEVKRFIGRRWTFIIEDYELVATLVAAACALSLYTTRESTLDRHALMTAYEPLGRAIPLTFLGIAGFEHDGDAQSMPRLGQARPGDYTANVLASLERNWDTARPRLSA